MDETNNSLVEKIVKDLNNVLSKPSASEFDIVPVESNRNKSPVLYRWTSVGLESWCVKHVYMECYKELMGNLTHPKRRLSKPSNHNYKRLTALLNATLILNPDITTLWNMRREMVKQNFLEWESELHFTRLVLSRKPKCNDAFMYRRWIFNDVLKGEVVHPERFIDVLIAEEIKVCEKAANKYPNNYHCWDHRRWLMITLENIGYDVDYRRQYFQEYKFSEDWTSNHVSDYSCFHYRQFCLKKLYYMYEIWAEFKTMRNVNLRNNLRKVIAAHVLSDPAVKTSKIFTTIQEDDFIALVLGHRPSNCKCYDPYYDTCRKLELLFFEIAQNDDMCKFYMNHETLWYHRRFIVHEILSAMYDHLEIERKNGKLVRKHIEAKPGELLNKCENCLAGELKEHKGKVEKYDVQWVYHSILFKVLIKHEKEFIKDRQNNLDKYAMRHEHYLKYVEGLNDFI